MLDEALTCMRWPLVAGGDDVQRRVLPVRQAPSSGRRRCSSRRRRSSSGGGGKGLLRVAAKHADVVNIISDAGKPGYIKLENVAKLTDDAFTSKVRFLRDEATRHGRDGKKIRISNMIFTCMLTDSPAATRATVEGMAPMFNTTPDGMLRSPMALIGTPDECIAELQAPRNASGTCRRSLRRRASTPRTQHRLAEEVLQHV